MQGLSQPPISLSICLFVAFLLAGSQVTWAETYRYRAPDGRWIISNTPPAEDAEVVTKRPEGSGPSAQTTAQVPTFKGRNQLRKQNLKKATRRQKRHQRQRQQIATPVNTHQFGLLQIGSSKAQVKRTLGPPAQKVKLGKEKRWIRIKGRYVQRNVKIEAWYYPGSKRIQPTRLVFYNGLLAEKDKGKQ